MNHLLTIARLIDRTNELIGRGMGWVTVFMVIVVFLVVVLRYAFGIGWIWMQELYVWAHACAFMLGAGYTLLHNGHVRIDLIYRDATKLYKSLVDLCGCVLLAAPLVWVLFDRSFPIILRSWNMGERSAEAGGLPALYLLKSVIVGFCILFGLQVVSLSIRSFTALFNQPRLNSDESS